MTPLGTVFLAIIAREIPEKRKWQLILSRK